MSDMPLTRATVEAAFQQMGKLLHRQHIEGEIILYGQAAIMLQFEQVTGTDDVDVQITENHGAVERAAHEVAAHQGWRRSWMNEAVTQYLPQRRSIRPFATYPLPERFGLRVWVALPIFLLALKLSAAREHDLEDAVLLARSTQVTSPTGLGELFRTFYPDHESDPPRDARRIGFIMEIAERCAD